MLKKTCFTDTTAIFGLAIIGKIVLFNFLPLRHEGHKVSLRNSLVLLSALSVLVVGFHS